MTQKKGHPKPSQNKKILMRLPNKTRTSAISAMKQYFNANGIPNAV